MKQNPLTGLRHIDDKLIRKFKASDLYQLVQKENLLACIRDNAIGIYYNSDRVAKVSLSKEELKCEISSYYLSDFYTTGVHKPSETLTVSDCVIVDNIETIIENSKVRETPEKKAQQHLIHLNNANEDSDWYCFDIEYRQSTNKQNDIPLFDGRFDILAISKQRPHRVAVIELKYGEGAIGGKSGIVKHIMDFRNFQNSKSCIHNFEVEVPAMLKNLREIGYNVPTHLATGKIQFSNKIEFIVICLYEGESTKGTVGGYLFDKKRPHWNTKRVSKSNNALTKLGVDVESPTCPININFLFKKVGSPIDLKISDILDTKQYD